MEIAAWKKCGDGLGVGQRLDVFGIDLLEMVATCRAKCHRKLRCAGARKLLRMQPGRQSEALAGFEDLLRLLSCECPAIAKDVAELRELFLCHFGNQFFSVKRDVSFHAFGRSAILRRDDM